MNTTAFAHRTVVALAFALAAGAAAADDRPSYGFVRTLDGAATVRASYGSGEELEVNQPLLTGDVLEIARRSRLEAVLSDRNWIRLDGGSALRLDALAFSDDARARETRLTLLAGVMQLTVTDEALGDELPRVDTGNAAIYVQAPGEYRLSTDGRSWSEIVVRRGYLEVSTARGSLVVRAGEAAEVDGDEWVRARVVRAPPEDGLERWARRLTDDGYAVRSRYVDSTLAYAAAPLDRYGSWISYSGGWAWQPRVEAGWRPYWNGRWHYTPSGYAWVSYDPWGPVPYHYGTWTLASGYGWVWVPGRVYSPAWVYWYWGDRYTGWCPVGYYTHYYRHRLPRHGFHFGLYGWVGGDWGFYADWNFSPVRWVFDRHGGRHHRRGVDLGRELGGGVPRGLLTTDTRGFDPRRLGGDRGVVEAIAEIERGRGGTRTLERLPEVTEFIARAPELSPEVRRRVTVEDRGPSPLAGTPLAPEGGVASQPTESSPGWREPGRRRGGGAVEGETVGVRGDAPSGRRDAPTAPQLHERPAELPSAPAESSGRERQPRLRERPTELPGTPSEGAGSERLPSLRERPARLEPGISESPAGVHSGAPSDERQGWRRQVRERPTELPSGTGGSASPGPSWDASPPVRYRAPVDGEPRSSEGDSRAWRRRSVEPYGGAPTLEAPRQPAGETRRLDEAEPGERGPRRGGAATWPTPSTGEPGTVLSEPSDRPPVRRFLDGVRPSAPAPPAEPRVESRRSYESAPRTRPSPPPTVSAPAPPRVQGERVRGGHAAPAPKPRENRPSSD